MAGVFNRNALRKYHHRKVSQRVVVRSQVSQQKLQFDFRLPDGGPPGSPAYREQQKRCFISANTSKGQYSTLKTCGAAGEAANSAIQVPPLCARVTRRSSSVCDTDLLRVTTPF